MTSQQTSQALEDYAAQPAVPASPRELACQLYVLAEGINAHTYRSVGLALRNLRLKLEVAQAAMYEPELLLAYAERKGKGRFSPMHWVKRAYEQFDLRSDYTCNPLKGMSQALRGQFTMCRMQHVLRAGPMKVTELASLLGISRQDVNRKVRLYPDNLSKPRRGWVALGKQQFPPPVLPEQFVALLLPESNLQSPTPFLTSMVKSWLAHPDCMAYARVSDIGHYIGSKLNEGKWTNPAYAFMPPRKRKASKKTLEMLAKGFIWEEGHGWQFSPATRFGKDWQTKLDWNNKHEELDPDDVEF